MKSRIARWCCSGEPEPRDGAQERCPECRALGKPVSTVTLKHMVNPKLLEAVNRPGFQFCRSPHCDVVYFHANGVRLHKADVRVRVGLKETDEPVPICYCFGFTEAMARQEIESTGECKISERI